MVNSAGTSNPAHDVLARYHTADRLAYADIATHGYGKAYVDILNARCVTAMCESIGVKRVEPRTAVQRDGVDVFYQDVLNFLNTKTTIKNAFTRFNEAIRVRNYLDAQGLGTMSTDEVTLHRQLDYMLNRPPIGEDNVDPIAAQASGMTRAALKIKLTPFATRISG